jgi:hypothetical protein
MIIIHCTKHTGCPKPVPALQPGIHFQGITTYNVYAVSNFQQSPPELCSTPTLVKQKAGDSLRMVFNDELRRVTGVGDLYTIGFDGVHVLGMKGFFQAHKHQDEQNPFHIWFRLFY